MTGDADRTAIGAIVERFFEVFTTTAGRKPELERLPDLFLPQAIIVKNVGASPEVYDIQTFIEPRRALLEGGTVTEFFEEETAENTEVFGAIAHRVSQYQKSWIADGERHTGRGVKSLQLVRTPGGWKIASLVWDDF